MRNFSSNRFWRGVALVGLTLLWGAVLLDLGLWLYRLSGGYSSKANLLSHLWPYISLGGALAGLLARGAPNALRSIPTVWLLISLALLFGKQVFPRESLLPAASPTLRVLTLNLSEYSERHPRAISFLKERRAADVLFLQEVHGGEGNGDRPKLKAALGGRLPYMAWHTSSGTSEKKFGLGIMSRHPLRQIRPVKLPAGGAPASPCRGMPALTAKLRVEGRVIRLATAHLCPPAVPWRNRQGHRTPVSLRSVSEWFSGIRPFEYARRSQLQFLRLMAEGGVEPFILAGNLNTTAHSLDLLELSKTLSDAFGERGLGFGFTYSAAFLGARIDHIFHSKGIRARDAFVHDVKVSDHRPLEAVLEIPLPKASAP